MNVRWKGLLAVAAVLLILAGGALDASAQGNGGSSAAHPMSIVHAVESGAHSAARLVGIDDNETQVAPGTLDDGKDLLPQAEHQHRSGHRRREDGRLWQRRGD